MFIAGSFLTGCEEQPIGYIFSPTQRDKTTMARTAGTVINAIYEHTDEAVIYLDQASLTDDYGSLLLGGWQAFAAIDSVDSTVFTYYARTYLDQKYYFLRFDKEPDPSAVRTPSNLDYNFTELRSYQNQATSEFFGDISQIRQLSIEYSDNRQDHRNVDGWLYIRTLIPIEREYETAGAGTVTYTINILVRWQVRLERYSIDPNDHRSRMVIAGIFPINDEAGEYHSAQVSGEIILDAKGKGSGDLWLYGEPAVRMNFTGRAFGFIGYFTLHEENHEKKYRLE